MDGLPRSFPAEDLDRHQERLEERAARAQTQTTIVVIERTSSVQRATQAARLVFGGVTLTVAAQEVGRNWCRLAPWQLVLVTALFAKFIHHMGSEIYKLSR